MNDPAAPLDCRIPVDDGVALSARVYPRDGAPRLVLSHGNGLAIDGYRCFWAPLTRDFEVAVLDLRHHGRSDGGRAGDDPWRWFADDMEAVWQHLKATCGARLTLGVFHSLSAVASLAHVRRYGPRWDGLLLFDPPLPPPAGHPLAPVHAAHMAALAQGARLRQRRFAAPGELAARFARHTAFRRWRADAYDDMAAAMLRPDAGGDGWILSCPPDVEAAIFETNTDADLWPVLQSMRATSKLVCADPDLPEAGAPALMGRAAAAEFGLDYAAVPDSTHFLQVERPDACRAITHAFARAFAQVHVATLPCH